MAQQCCPAQSRNPARTAKKFHSPWARSIYALYEHLTIINIQPVYFLFQNVARVGIGPSEDCIIVTIMNSLKNVIYEFAVRVRLSSAMAFVKPQLIQCVYSSSELRVGSLVFPILVVCWLVNCSKREEKMEL